MTKTAALAVALALTATTLIGAQTKTVTGEAVTVTAEVVAVEQQSRTLTLKKKDGTYTTVIVPESYQRFSGIKAGDTVTARYYENVVFRKLNPGEKPVNEASGGITPGGTDRPVGTAAVQRTITTRITAIDHSVPSITFTGPNNWVYNTGVKDKALLKQVNVGDLVNITWTEALSIEVTPPK